MRAPKRGVVVEQYPDQGQSSAKERRHMRKRDNYRSCLPVW